MFCKSFLESSTGHRSSMITIGVMHGVGSNLRSSARNLVLSNFHVVEKLDWIETFVKV